MTALQSVFLLAQIAEREGNTADALSLMQKAMSLGGRTPLLVSMWGFIQRPRRPDAGSAGGRSRS